MKTTIVTIQNDKVEGLLPAKYTLGTYVHVEITTIKNGIITTQSRYGYIASMSLAYWQGDYYSSGYVRKYGISNDFTMEQIILWVGEDDIIPAQEEEK